MAYATTNFPSKKALKTAVESGAKIGVFSPGLGGPYAGRTSVLLEGPHYPKPHTWAATVSVDNDGFIAKVK